jgi:hypothetical protein
MAAEYSRPAFSGPLFKGSRGALVLAREKAQAEFEALERREKAKAKKRDGGRCRWPEAHKCRFGLESAHVVDASLGGRMASSNLVTVCAWVHRRGPESIHGKQIKVEPLTAAGADGPLSFWRKDAAGAWFMVAREVAPGRIERD